MDKLTFQVFTNLQTMELLGHVAKNVKFGSTSNFGQVSYFKKDGYIYMVGTITGRDNKPHLARFLEENIENQTEYEIFGMEVEWIKRK